VGHFGRSGFSVSLVSNPAIWPVVVIRLEEVELLRANNSFVDPFFFEIVLEGRGVLAVVDRLDVLVLGEAAFLVQETLFLLTAQDRLEALLPSQPHRERRLHILGRLRKLEAGLLLLFLNFRN